MDQEQLSGTDFEGRSLDYVPQAMWIPQAQQVGGAARTMYVCTCGAASTVWIFLGVLGRKTRGKQRAGVAWRIVRLKLQTQDPPSAARVWAVKLRAWDEQLQLSYHHCNYCTHCDWLCVIVTQSWCIQPIFSCMMIRKSAIPTQGLDKQGVADFCFVRREEADHTPF